jgi:hypothetical protein
MSKQQQQKDSLIAASNALGFQARQLRKAAEANDGSNVDVLLKTFKQIGDEAATDQRSAHDAEVARTAATIAPLIARAEASLTHTKTAVSEHGPLVRRLATLPFDAIRKQIPDRVVPGSLHSTITRVALLQRVIGEALEILNATDVELESALARVKRLTALDTSDAQRDVATLAYWLGPTGGGRGVTIEEKMRAANRLLAELAEDFLSGEGEKPVPSAPPAALPRETATISPLLWPAWEQGGVPLPAATDNTIPPSMANLK